MNCTICKKEMIITSSRDEFLEWGCRNFTPPKSKDEHISDYKETGEWWWSFYNGEFVVEMNHFPPTEEYKIIIYNIDDQDIDSLKYENVYNVNPVEFKDSFDFCQKFLKLIAFS